MLSDLIFYIIMDIRKIKISIMERKLDKLEKTFKVKSKIYRDYLLDTKMMIDNRKEGK